MEEVFLGQAMCKGITKYYYPDSGCFVDIFSNFKWKWLVELGIVTINLYLTAQSYPLGLPILSQLLLVWNPVLRIVVFAQIPYFSLFKLKVFPNGQSFVCLSLNVM